MVVPASTSLLISSDRIAVTDSPSGAAATPSFPRRPLMMQSDSLISLSSRSMPTESVTTAWPLIPTPRMVADTTPLAFTMGPCVAVMIVPGSRGVESSLDGPVIALWRTRLADSDDAIR